MCPQSSDSVKIDQSIVRKEEMSAEAGETEERSSEDGVQIARAREEEDKCILATIRSIRASQSVTGKEYNTISLWLFVCSFAFNGVAFGIIYYMIDSRTLLIQDNHNVAFYGVLAAAILTFIETTISAGYCIYKRRMPLPKSRLTAHLAIVLGLLVTLILLTFFITIDYLGIISVPESIRLLLISLRWVTIGASMSTLLARQRLIYIIFSSKIKVRRNPRRIYMRALVFCTSICALMLIPFIILYKMDGGEYRKWGLLPLSAISCILVLILLLYTYWTKSTPAFSDTRSNIRIAVVLCCSLSTSYIVGRLLLAPDPREITRETSLNFILLPALLGFFAASVVVMDMFGTIALITYLGYDLRGGLDPRRRDHTTSHLGLPRVPIDMDERPAAKDEEKGSTSAGIGNINPIQGSKVVLSQGCSDDNTISVQI